jgi:hypothetical protein
MADLSELAKKLQAQVDIITEYLAKEKLPPPSFLPSKDEHPLKTTITKLPPDIEKARHAAQSLSWSINTLLTPPAHHLVWTAFQVFSKGGKELTKVLRCRGRTIRRRKGYR